MEQEKNWSYVRTGHLEIVSDLNTSCRKCSESHIPVSVSMPCSKVRTACPCVVQTPELFLGTDKAVKFQCPGRSLGQCLGVHKALSTPRVMGWREWNKVPQLSLTPLCLQGAPPALLPGGIWSGAGVGASRETTLFLGIQWDSWEAQHTSCTWETSGTPRLILVLPACSWLLLGKGKKGFSAAAPAPFWSIRGILERLSSSEKSSAGPMLSLRIREGRSSLHPWSCPANVFGVSPAGSWALYALAVILSLQLDLKAVSLLIILT